MRIGSVNYAPPLNVVINEASRDDIHTISLMTDTMKVSVTEAPDGWLTIHCDPRGENFLSEVDLREASLNQSQARLVLRGARRRLEIHRG